MHGAALAVWAARCGPPAAALFAGRVRAVRAGTGAVQVSQQRELDGAQAHAGARCGTGRPLRRPASCATSFVQAAGRAGDCGRASGVKSRGPALWEACRGVMVGSSEPARTTAATLIAVSVGCGVGEDGKKMILLPLPAAGTANCLYVLAYVGVEAGDWPVNSDANLLVMYLIAKSGVLARQYLNFGRDIESSLMRPPARWPCQEIPCDEVSERP